MPFLNSFVLELVRNNLYLLRIKISPFDSSSPILSWSKTSGFSSSSRILVVALFTLIRDWAYSRNPVDDGFDTVSVFLSANSFILLIE